MRYRMVLDADKGDDRFSVAESIRIRQGDSLSYELEIDVRQGGEVVDLSDYAVRLYATKPDGSAVIDGENLEVVDAAAGRVLYTVPRQLVDAVGKVSPCYLRVTEAANQSEWSLSTDSFELDVVRGVGASLASGEYVPEIDGLLADMDRQLDDFQAAEDGRASAEALRETDEAARVEAERQRAEAEEARRTYEEARQSDEDLRIANESGRVTAENARKAAEEEREAEFAVFAAKAAQWAVCILQEGEYDEASRVPTLAEGSMCTWYMVPSADPGEGNAYDEWLWVGDRFERVGAATAVFPVATDAEVAGILDGTVTQGGSAVTVTGMAALKAAFDLLYAPAEHGHDIEDVEGLRGELDGLDGRIAKLPTVADLDSAVEALGVIDDALEANLTALYDSAMQTLRGTCSDVSYVSLRALAPGCYLVPSTATNQPTSGQGDANLLVAQDSSNRVWALLAYNTGACYMAYGYATGSGASLVTTNFKWARLDNGPVAVEGVRGTLSDVSMATLITLKPGRYLVAKGATSSPAADYYGNLLVFAGSTDRCWAVCCFDSGSVWYVKGYVGASSWQCLTQPSMANATGTLAVAHGGTGATTVAGARNALGLGNTSGALPVANGGTGATSVAAARNALGLGNTSGALPLANGGTGATSAAAALTNLGITFGSDTSDANNTRYWLKVGKRLVQWGYANKGNQGAHGYYGYNSTLPQAYADANYVAMVTPYWTGLTNGDSLGWTSLTLIGGNTTTSLKYAAGNGTASTLGLWVYWMTIGVCA